MNYDKLSYCFWRGSSRVVTCQIMYCLGGTYKKVWSPLNLKTFQAPILNHYLVELKRIISKYKFGQYLKINQGT